MSTQESMGKDLMALLLDDIDNFEIEKMDEMTYTLSKIDFLKKVLDMYANFHIYSIAFTVNESSTTIIKDDLSLAQQDKVSQIVEGIKELPLAEIEDKTFSEFIPGLTCKQMLEILPGDYLHSLSEASYYGRWNGDKFVKSLTFENASLEIRLLSLKRIAGLHVEKYKKSKSESSES